MMIRSLLEVFSELPDFRDRKGRRHEVAQVLSVVTLGLLSGQDNPRRIAQWGRKLDRRKRQRLKLWRNKVPSESTIRRVLRKLDLDSLIQTLSEWIHEVAEVYGWEGPLTGLSIDGKTLRGTRDPEGAVSQVLQATLHEVGAVLNLAPIPARTNELGSIDALLEGLVLEGKVVTLDALYTHPDLAARIDTAQGLYVMRVKGNQPRLLDALRLWFEQPEPIPDTQC